MINSTARYISEENENTNSKRYMHFSVHSGIICNRQDVEPISEKTMAPHSSTLAWKIPWMEEPGGLQSMGSLRVRHG